MKDFFNRLFGDTNETNKSGSNIRFLNSQNIINGQWIEIFTHFILLDEPGKMPTKAWYKDLERMISQIGSSEFLDIGTQWIEDCLAMAKKKDLDYHSRYGIISSRMFMEHNLKNGSSKAPEWVKKVYGENYIYDFFVQKSYSYLNSFQYYFFYSLGGRILRGFIHSSVILNDNRLVRLVDLVALGSPNTSQDCIFIYSKLPKDIAIPKLAFLKSKVTHKFIIARIEKALTEVGKSVGLSKSEVEELVVPDFGINSIGEFTAVIADITCICRFQNFKNSKQTYVGDNGKELKTAPNVLKEQFLKDFNTFKSSIKEISNALNVQKKRIEEFYLIDRKIKYEDFINNYLNNNLVKIIAKDMIWVFNKEGKRLNLMYQNDSFVDSNGEKYLGDLSGSIVSLWHPIGLESDFVLQWRRFLDFREIMQPFKQAYREVYLITDAEVKTEFYSNRFASHILNKDHVGAIAKVRGWSTSGIFNDDKLTYKIHNTNYKAEYRVTDTYLGVHSKIYGSGHVSTDQVRFFTNNTLTPLLEVPAIIFSEVMRDIDLFVGVTSIGNDPNWYDQGVDRVRNYWSSYTKADLSESSKIRADVLKNIIPKMSISKYCEFEGKYLKVKGKLRSYKIHIGSSNILMEPNDAYLCIVPDGRKLSLNKAFIPFEGDHLLSIIISKAVLLVNDDKIEDSSIINQINIK